MIIYKKLVLFSMLGVCALTPVSVQAKDLLAQLGHAYKLAQHIKQEKSQVAPQDYAQTSSMQATDIKMPNACPQHYPLGAPMVVSVERDKILRRSFYLCEDNYAVQFDPATKTPLWVSEHLIGQQQAGTHVKRVDNFQPHPLVPRPAQATLADYKGSGFDRGHNAPAADMLNARSMEQSFYLTNMFPQVEPNMNRGIWADLEEMVRKWSEARSEVIAVTGPVFNLGERSLTMGRSQVLIPTHLYKVVIDPKTNETIAFLMPNRQIITRKSLSSRSKDEGNPMYPQTTPAQAVNCERVCTIDDFIVPLGEIEKYTGLSFFTKLNEVQKQTALKKGRMWTVKK